MSISHIFNAFHKQEFIDFKVNDYNEEFSVYKQKTLNEINVIDQGDETSLIAEGFKIESLNEFNALLHDRAKYIDFIDCFLKNKKVSIRCPLTSIYLTSDVSISGHLFNFIYFYCESLNEVFYLVQNHQVLSGLFFPARSLYIKYAGGSHKSYIDFLYRRVFHHYKFLKQKIQTSETKETYLMVSCPRPWHFFYNFATALNIIDNYTEDKELKTCYMPGGLFLSHDKIVKRTCNSSEFTFADLNKDVSRFIIFPGVSYDDTNNQEHQLLRDRVIDNLEEPERNKEFITIWIGVTGQKRVWVEQIEGISKLITLMVNNFDNIHILFDGWTSPVNKTAKDEEQINKDKDVVSEIIKRLGARLSYELVIGSTAEEKITKALSCDFYVTNYASGSIFVSRFAQINGLSHLNNLMPRQHHLHYNNIEVKHTLVTDIIENNKTGHNVSYSISPNDFIEEYKRFFNSLNIEDILNFKIN